MDFIIKPHQYIRSWIFFYILQIKYNFQNTLKWYKVSVINIKWFSFDIKSKELFLIVVFLIRKGDN